MEGSDLKNHIKIKELPDRLRPRERLISSKAESLSDVELVAILLSTGVRGINALELSQLLIQTYETVGAIGNADLNELLTVPGMGPAKAARLIAGIELGRRAATDKSLKKMTINSSESVASFLMPSMRHLEKECFKALILNTKNQLIKVTEIAVGSLNSAIVHPRELFRSAIKSGGAGLIVAHNHPSGDPSPSDDDIKLTKRLVGAGEIVGIELLDHVIIGDGRYSSLKELNYI